MSNPTSSQTNPSLDLYLVKLAGKYSKYQPNEVVFRESEPGNTMLLVLKGSVIITKQDESTGQPMLLATRYAGEMIGEMALVEEGNRSATVSAESECEVLEFTKENFEKVIKSHPSFATRVLKSLSTKLRESDTVRTSELAEHNRLLTASNNRLLKLNSFLDCVIDQSPTPILLVTKNEYIFRLNRAAGDMFGIDHTDEDHRLHQLLTDLNFSGVTKDLEGTWFGEVKGKRGKQEFSVSVSITALPDFQNETVFLLICQDLERLQMSARAIQDYERFISGQYTAVELACTMGQFVKGEFDDNEELKTALQDDADRKVRKNALEIAHRTLRDVLQFTRNFVTYRGTKYDYGFIDLRLTVGTIIRFCRSQKRFANIQFEFKSEKEFPKKLFVKGIQIQNLLMNILINSVEAFEKSGNRDDNQITIELIRPKDEDDSVIVTISDNGPGMIADDLKKIFNQRFSTKSGGLGLSLLNAKKVLASHGGDIQVNSQPGRGTNFRIKLPLRSVKRDA